MMTLLVIRHGPAEGHRPGVPDGERALTEEGRAFTRGAMEALVQAGYVPTRGFASPFRRAAETLDCLREAAGTGFPVDRREELLPEADPWAAEAWLRELLSGLDDGEVVALVSHQPFVSGFARHLTGRDVEGRKASCTVLQWDGRAFRFVAHLQPPERS